MSACPNVGWSEGNCRVQSMTAGLKRPQQRSRKKETRFRTTPRLQGQRNGSGRQRTCGAPAGVAPPTRGSRSHGWPRPVCWPRPQRWPRLHSLVRILSEGDGLLEPPLLEHQRASLSRGQAQKGDLRSRGVPKNRKRF